MCAPWVLAVPRAERGVCSFLEALSPLSWTPGPLWAVLHLALHCNLQHTDLSRSVSCWKPSVAPDRTVSLSSFLTSCKTVGPSQPRPWHCLLLVSYLPMPHQKS